MDKLKEDILKLNAFEIQEVEENKAEPTKPQFGGYYRKRGPPPKHTYKKF